jgi:GntR family transcriptional regulator of gluconate operon
MGDTMLKRENISDKLADAIGKKIIHNELKSGEIITEAQISKEWNISRSPVRDALHILKNKWLLEKS